MPFHDKVADFLDDVIPNEIKPYLGTAAAAYAGPALGGLMGGGILQNFLGGAASDILAQKLLYGSDEDRDTDYLSAGMSGILSGLQAADRGFLGKRDPVARRVDTSVPGVQERFKDRLAIGEGFDRGDYTMATTGRTGLPQTQLNVSAFDQAVIDAGGVLPATVDNPANYFQSDFLKGVSDFADPFDFTGVGQSATPIRDIIGETTSSIGMLQLGQTPSQVRDAAKALKDAERRYQEYLNRLDEEQAASAAADMAARVAAYKEYMGLAGFTNAEIDAALVEAGYLASGETAFSQGGRVGFDTGGMTDSMGLGNYMEAEKVRTEFTDKIKRMLQTAEMNMKMNDPGLMRFANAMIPGGEGFYTREEMRFPSLKSKYESILQKFERDQAKDDYEREQIRKQMQETRKSEFEDIVNMIDDRFSDNRQQRKKANTGGRMTSEGDPISPDVPPGMQMDLRPGGFIPLGTAPKADDVPAMVGKNEFVLNDEAVSGIGKLITGKPDPRAGARALYKLQDEMEAIV